jgi:hypothetical protein
MNKKSPLRVHILMRVSERVLVMTGACIRVGCAQNENINYSFTVGHYTELLQKAFAVKHLSV